MILEKFQKLAFWSNDFGEMKEEAANIAGVVNSFRRCENYTKVPKFRNGERANQMKATIAKAEEISLLTDHDFTSACKQQILAYAKKSYAQHGRGAVVVELCNTVLVEGGLFVPLDYFNEQVPLFEKLEGWPDEEMQQMVSSYNPRREAVCAIIDKPKSLAYSLIKGR